MSGLFQSILQMSITGSFVILFVYLVRLLLKRVPKIYSYVLWAVVLFRLLCPVTITSSFSLVPREIASPQMHEIVEESELPGSEEHQEMVPLFTAEESRLPDVVMEEGKIAYPVGETEAEPAVSSTQPEVKLRRSLSGGDVAAIVWMLGVFLMVCYSVLSLKRIYRRVQIAVLHEGNVYIAQDIDTPFTLGVFSPKIYLPTGLTEKEMVYIIAHEKHHIKRWDHFIKMVAFFTLSIHWFNPLVWFAFVQAGKDMEMSCDEAVMKAFPEDIRREYSGSLLNLATGKKIVAMAPLAFGEGSVKGRIKNIMHYKKPSFWVIIGSVVVCICLGISLCSNPKIDEPMREVIVWEKQVDYNGDGTEDSISFTVLADDSYEEFRDVTDGHELLFGPFVGTVRCICGDTGELDFESGNISHDRLGNCQISYAEIDDSHYMITTQIGEQMGGAYYSYEVYSLTEQELVDSYEVNFVTAGDDFRARPTDRYRQEVVPEFKGRLEKWIADAVLIVATDVNEPKHDGIIVSSTQVTYEASYYYDSVWERMLDEKIRVDNYGLKVNLPMDEEWILNPQYLLSSYPVAHIKYYDKRAEASVLLRYGELEHIELAYLYDMEFDEDLQAMWYADCGDEQVEIQCRVSHFASEEDMKTVLVSWTYAGLNYVIFGELNEGADETALAETAVYVVEHFQGENPESNTVMQEEFVEKEINVLYGDLTGDGIDERIVLGIDVLPESVQENDFEKLLHSAYLAKVSVYKGLGGDSYEEDTLWSFDDISTSRPGNYQLSLIEKYEKDYLLISSIQEQQGYADYYYKVISLAESGEEILQDEYEVSFKFAETSEAAEWQQEEELPIRSDVVPDFQEHLSKWYDGKGTLIIATDLNMWGEDAEGVLYSKPDFWVWYMKYYEKVFERQDYYTLAEKTMFQTKYFTFELPEQWADKVHYEETEDGKVVWLYHTKTSELEWGMGLLGTIFLEEEELAMETMDMVPARYIGEPYVAEDGKTYMPMSCQPTDVQCLEETAREYNEMSAYFADGRMAKHVWVTENGTYNNPLWELAFYHELYPEYGLASRRAACFGQKLPWEGYPEDYILFDSDGENHTLIINDRDYSAMLKDSLYLENIDNAWYAVVDAYEVDNSREIIIFDDGPSGDPHLHVLQVTDGELSVVGELGTLSFMSSFVFSGKQRITLLERTWLPENNVVTKSYMIEDKKLVEIPRGEYEFVYKDFHKLLKDLEVYKEQDLSSEMVTLKAEEDWIRFNKVFSSAEEGERFYEIETMDREIYYLYSDGWLDDYVADLSHAG